MQEIRVKNLKELESFADAFVADLASGGVVGLVGDLGAGKTTFVQRVAKALGVKEKVKSPTFILMQSFRTGAAATKRGVRRLCHVDAYRLKDEAELFGIGFEEYAADSETLTLVEWADRVPAIHAFPGYRELTLSFTEESDGRIVRIG
jgi:tRNA threonylcarbamoyladenosine biosynthesis protein TsaE